MNGSHITVAICAYNAQETIAESLASLFVQTSHDFEILVVDDGSTDGTLDVVRLEATKTNTAVCVISTSHSGLAVARNAAVEYSTSEYLAFLDADDTFDSSAIEKLFTRAKDTDADIVVCDMLYTDFETGDAMHVYHQGDVAAYRGGLLESPGLLAQLGGSACNKLFRRALFETDGIRFPDGHTFEDLWTVYRLFALAKRIDKVDEPLYHYRQARSGSIMSQYDDRYLDIVKGLAVTNDFYAEKSLFEPLQADLLALNFYHAIYGRYTNLLTYGSRDVRHRYLQQAFAHMDRYFPSWRRSLSVTAMCGRPARTLVFTHRLLLKWWTDWRARMVADA